MSQVTTSVWYTIWVSFIMYILTYIWSAHFYFIISPYKKGFAFCCRYLLIANREMQEGNFGIVCEHTYRLICRKPNDNRSYACPLISWFSYLLPFHSYFWCVTILSDLISGQFIVVALCIGMEKSSKVQEYVFLSFFFTFLLCFFLLS